VTNFIDLLPLDGLPWGTGQVYAELKPFKIGLCIRDIAETLPTLLFPSKTAGYDETRADRPSSAPEWRTITVRSTAKAAPGTCTAAPFLRPHRFGRRRLQW